MMKRYKILCQRFFVRLRNLFPDLIMPAFPGGHCDGDADVLRVAIKEACEETGLRVKPLGTAIFDVDNHPIPEKHDIPGHIHYDIRFLLTAEKDAEELPGNSEVNAIRWIKLEEVHKYNNEESVMRMVRKTNS